MHDEYDQIPAVRRSALWEIRKSPLHYKYVVTHPEEPTEALRFGIAAHKYILEPGAFWDEYVEVPKIDRRTKAGKEAYNVLLASGKEFVTETDMETIRAMDEALCSNPTAAALLKTGDHEVSFQWNDEETGEPCKCRVDCLTEFDGVPYIVDYKTTTSCEDGAFERSCRAYGYKLQCTRQACSHRNLKTGASRSWRRKRNRRMRFGCTSAMTDSSKRGWRRSGTLSVSITSAE